MGHPQCLERIINVRSELENSRGTLQWCPFAVESLTQKTFSRKEEISGGTGVQNLIYPLKFCSGGFENL